MSAPQRQAVLDRLEVLRSKLEDEGLYVRANTAWLAAEFIKAHTMTPEELIAYRHKLGISQQTLAERWGISKRTIIRWEKGEVPIPKLVDLAIHTTP